VLLKAAAAQYRLIDRRDRSELQSEGSSWLTRPAFLQDSLPQSGTLTRREPSKTGTEDIEYGLEIAREIARLDLGQTIVVRGKRAWRLKRWKALTRRSAARAACEGSIDCGESREAGSGHAFRCPVVGVPTIEAMVEAGATCLCITAGKTLMFDRDEMIRAAEKHRFNRCI
jgi:DUF1009 family protein